VVIGGEKYALHLLPSGILSPGVVPVIGNGVVVDIDVLFEEIDALEARGVDTSALRVSSAAHVIAPYNRTLDKVTERFLGKRRIGTTGRGIGPAYSDKINRVGIRIQDLFDEKILREKVEGALDQKNHLLVKVYNRRAITVDETVEDLLRHADRLQPLVADTPLLLNTALDQGKTLVFEAGQATMLDVDHGTYPFVTSSSAVAGGACTGSGIGPSRIRRTIGITKAYATRVGEGPFPTELSDATGDRIRDRGGEFGSVTGRPRRTGWLDLPALRYAARVNGIDGWAITKLDVLTGLEAVQVCVAYETPNGRTEDLPLSSLDRATPILESFEGWTQPVEDARSLSDLPSAAADLVRAIEERTEIGADIVSVGPRRDQTIVVRDLFR